MYFYQTKMIFCVDTYYGLHVLLLSVNLTYKQRNIL